MMRGPLACVNCHGPEGHGGTVNLMMQTFDVPDITWPELTAQHDGPSTLYRRDVKTGYHPGA